MGSRLDVCTDEFRSLKAGGGGSDGVNSAREELECYLAPGEKASYQYEGWIAAAHHYMHIISDSAASHSV